MCMAPFPVDSWIRLKPAVIPHLQPCPPGKGAVSVTSKDRGDVGGMETERAAIFDAIVDGVVSRTCASIPELFTKILQRDKLFASVTWLPIRHFRIYVVP